METVVLVIHLLICIGLVAVVMLQRSEGGALGIGGGGGSLISGRGAANALVRTTMVLAGVFIVTSLTLTRISTERAKAPDAIERELENRDGLTATPAAPAVDPLAPATQAAPGLTPAAPVETSPLAPPAALPSMPATSPPQSPTSPAGEATPPASAGGAAPGSTPPTPP